MKPIAPIESPIAQTPTYKAPVVTPTQSNVPTQTPTPEFGRKPETQKVRPDVYSAISQAAQKFGVPTSFMLDLGFSESSLDPNKTNKDAPDIAPQGLFQFTNNAWGKLLKYANDPNSGLYGVLPDTNRFNPVTNSLAAAYLISHGQLGQWDASEWNWGEQWTPQELEARGFYDQSIYQKQNPGMRASVRLGAK
jgi:hypothetical protein